MNAKIIIIIITALTACITKCEEIIPYGGRYEMLPHQVVMSDIIGIGTFESQTETNVVINVSQYWFGNQQTNILNIRIPRSETLPAGETNYMFFASTYQNIEGYCPSVADYSRIFNVRDVHSQGRYHRVKPYLFSGNRSWFPVTEENAAIISWSSNLVQASHVSTNLLAFYELIRDGYNNNLISSKVWRDSRYAIWDFNSYMSSNFIHQIWADTNLIFGARAWVGTYYTLMYDSSLEWPDFAIEYDSALPLLAGICDVAGIGELESQTGTNAVIRVIQYWLGNSQTNTLDVHVPDGNALPTGGTQFQFFLSKHSQIATLEPVTQRYAFLFNMEEARSKSLPDGLRLLGGRRSFVPVTEDNAALISWSSNLVQVLQVNPNIQAFYELIRDGNDQNPPASRMHRDSEIAFSHCGYYIPVDFMRQMLSDTNTYARGYIRSEYRRVTDSGE